jgi:hypothetical protein
MKTVRGVLAVAAAIAVIVLGSTAAMAVTFDVDVSVGWINTSGTCTSGTSCLGFNGTGGFTGTSLILNWDNGTASGDSFLRVGALPDTAGFPVGSASTTIDPGQTVRTAEVQHENNVLPGSESFLAGITLQTLLVITAPGGIVILDETNGGALDVNVAFNETPNKAPCTPGSISVCDDIFTFVTIEADIPFTFDGIDYILQVRGLLDQNGNPTCTENQNNTVNCTTQENQINNRFVQITLIELTQNVPAPASLLLVGLGLLGAGALPLLRGRRAA